MHDHQHDHKNSSSNRIGWAFFLNVSFTIIEFVGGVLTNSTAIMADAVHDLGDSLSIGLAWLLSKLGSKEPNGSFTYGYQRFSLLGALINGLVLIAGSLWVLNAAIPRLFEPQQPHAVGMFWLAILGVVVNGYAAFKLSHGKTLNERVLNWHLLEDVLGWVAVLIVAVTLMFVDWPILDPLLSIGFTLFILVNVVRNFIEAISLLMQGTPSGSLHSRVVEALLEIEHVEETHHVHLWSLDGESHVLTAHLRLDKTVDSERQKEMKEEIGKVLDPFSFLHTTIEFEFPDEYCRDN
ncbi:cation transporter [Halioglobus maricola]|jgi:cobalt-zinc-cadmium efflux system protein|uniref:Cation transporter n=1 Tax=Halioglobus maricola TaxID=2601894 RepID=A0A5P9NN72_9GAMM|nr:cation diffusion facilitator family transporter [Halioglobus maricola]QFU76368.1 cation transporter [Halioglobus maricola]